MSEAALKGEPEPPDLVQVAATGPVEPTYIFGVHNIEPQTEAEKGAQNLITPAGGAARESWTVFSIYTQDYHEKPGEGIVGIDYDRIKAMKAMGYSPIIRLDYDRGQTFPPRPWWQPFPLPLACEAGWAEKVVKGIEALSVLCDGGPCSTTFILGNEMNLSSENGGHSYGVGVDTYASCFAEVRQGMKQKGINAKLLVGATGPLNANTTAICPGAELYDHPYKKYEHCLVQATVNDADGFAVHAYGGRRDHPDPGSDDPTDGFQNYKLQLGIIDGAGGAGKPIYITEFNNAGDLKPGGFAELPYPDNFIQKAYADVNSFNGANGCRIKALVWFVFHASDFPGLSLTNWREDTLCGGAPCNLRQAFRDFQATALHQEYRTDCSVDTKPPGGDPALLGAELGGDVGEAISRLIKIVNWGSKIDYLVESQVPWLSIEAGAQGTLVGSEAASIAVHAVCGGALPSEKGSVKVTFKDRYGTHARSLPVSLRCGGNPPNPPGTPPGGSHGDPHLRTLDGLLYDFQGAGEYVLVKGGSDLAVQVREQPLGASESIAVNTAVALRIGAHRIGIYAGVSPALRIDGVVTAVVSRLELSGGHVIYRAGDRYVITSAAGDYIVIDLQASRLDVRINPAPSRAGSLRGLLGDGDGDPGDDFTTSGGMVLSPPLSSDALYRTFGDSFRVTQAESLFDYAPGETTATFTILDFPRATATLSDLPQSVRDQASATCSLAGVTDPFLLDACVLDVGMSGDPSFAASSAAAAPPVVGMREIYATNVEGSVGPEWSTARTSVTPVGARRFLGEFSNETVTLSLSNVPPHSRVRVSFDLLVIRSWDGNDGDLFTLHALASPSSFPLTFANTDKLQSFPDLVGAGSHPSRTGAVESNSLGYSFYGDAVYRLSYELPHDQAELKIHFTGSGLQDINDESWGLDNIEVVAR